MDRQRLNENIAKPNAYKVIINPITNDLKLHYGGSGARARQIVARSHE